VRENDKRWADLETTIRIAIETEATHDVRVRKKNGVPRRVRIVRGRGTVVRKAKIVSAAKTIERRIRTESAAAAEIVAHPRRSTGIEAFDTIDDEYGWLYKYLVHIINPSIRMMYSAFSATPL
jgi:hypothetical protein